MKLGSILTKEEAKELSLLKWWVIINTRLDISAVENLLDSIGFSQYISGCAYCAKYQYSHDMYFCYCVGCPIASEKRDHLYGNLLSCQDPGHPFSEWLEERTPEKAMAVYDLVEKS